MTVPVSSGALALGTKAGHVTLLPGRGLSSGRGRGLPGDFTWLGPAGAETVGLRGFPMLDI